MLLWSLYRSISYRILDQQRLSCQQYLAPLYEGRRASLSSQLLIDTLQLSFNVVVVPRRRFLIYLDGPFLLYYPPLSSFSSRQFRNNVMLSRVNCFANAIFLQIFLIFTRDNNTVTSIFFAIFYMVSHTHTMAFPVKCWLDTKPTKLLCLVTLLLLCGFTGKVRTSVKLLILGILQSRRYIFSPKVDTPLTVSANKI